MKTQLTALLVIVTFKSKWYFRFALQSQSIQENIYFDISYLWIDQFVSGLIDLAVYWQEMQCGQET